MNAAAQWLWDTLGDPAACLGILLVLLTCAIARLENRLGKRPRLLTVASATVTSALFVLGNPGVANSLLGGLENEPGQPQNCGPGARGVVVVLAGGIRGEVYDAVNYEYLREESLRRLIAAVRLSQSSEGSVLLVSGGQGKIQREADLMAQFARDLGLPGQRIAVERDSQNTLESSRRVAEMLSKMDYAGRPVLVTSAMHMRRAAQAFAMAGVDVCPAPVDFQLIAVHWWDTLLPQLSALSKSQRSLHEWAGLALYALRPGQAAGSAGPYVAAGQGLPVQALVGAGGGGGAEARAHRPAGLGTQDAPP